MFRLTVCCLVLGAALANPVEKASGTSTEWDDHVISSKEETLHSERAAIEVESRGLSDDPQPLPKPTTNSTDLRAYYILYPGLYYLTSPNYPVSYAPGSYSYYLVGSSGQIISINCNPFNVPCSAASFTINGVEYCNSGPVSVSEYYLSIVFNAYLTSSGYYYCLITVP